MENPDEFIDRPLTPKGQQPRSYQLRMAKKMKAEREGREGKRQGRGSEPEAEEAPLAPPKTKGDIQRAQRKSVDVTSVLKGITTAFTPEEVQQYLRDAMDYAVVWKSWEGILQILKFQAEYTVGKPVQRSMSVNLTPERFAAMMSDDEEEYVELEGE